MEACVIAVENILQHIIFLYTILNPAQVNTLKVQLNSFDKLQLVSVSMVHTCGHHHDKKADLEMLKALCHARLL